MSNHIMGPQHSTGLPQVKGPEMNDRDLVNDILSTEKYLAAGYNTAVNEASGRNLFQTQLQMLTEVHQAQRDVFDLMQKKGWYKTEAADANKTTQKTQQFSNYRTQFPYA